MQIPFGCGWVCWQQLYSFNSLLSRFVYIHCMFRTRVRAILITTLVAGSLDILLAFLNAWLGNAVTPTRVLQYIASGYFGAEAFAGGPGMARWGLLFHYLTALVFTTVFFFLFAKGNFWARHRVLTAIAYGLLIWIIMNLVVLPMSRVPASKMEPVAMIKGMIMLIVAMGLPLVFFSAMYRKKSSKS